MAPLTLKDNKEVVVFKAFLENASFAKAFEEIRDYDERFPLSKVVNTTEDVMALKECHKDFRKALAIAFRGDETPDMGNVQNLNRLKNVFEQQQALVYRSLDGDYINVTAGKIGMGKILLRHTDRIKKLGKKYMNAQKREESKVVRQPATVDSYRPLSRGYGNRQVFSTKDTYKTNREVLISRMIKNREIS